MTSHNFNLKYRPEIDGLRAIAVISVLIYHAPKIYISDFQLLQGGYLGVDIFFVISGYLITSLILKELNLNKSFSFLNFFQRRIRRIIPAFTLMIFVCFIFAWMFLLPNNFIDFSKSSLSSVFFVSNYFFFLTEYNYSLNIFKNPLLHTWSLSVEEQFYIFFPFLTFVLYKKNYIKLLSFFWIIFVLGLFFSSITLKSNDSLAFYSIHTRLWELALGSIVSYYEINLKIKSANNNLFKFLPLLGFILILSSLFLFNDKTSHPSVITLAPTIGTAIILYYNNSGIVNKLLSLKILTSVGLISYSLYLWHYPIFAFAENIETVEGDIFNKSLQFILLFLFIIFFVSWLSYEFVEKPFRNKNLKFRYVIFFIIFFSSFIIVGNTINILLKGKLNSSNVEFYSLISPKDYDAQCKFIASKNLNFEIKQENLNRIDNCFKKKNQFIVIIGDSHAQNLFNALSLNSNDVFIIGLIQHGCRPSKKDCNLNKFLRFVEENKKKIKAIVATSKGSFFLTNLGNPRNENYTSARGLPIIENEVDMTIDFFTKLDKVFPLIYVGPHIEPNIEITKSLYSKLKGDKQIINSLYNYQNFDLKEVDNLLNSKMSENGITYLSKIKILDFKLERDFFVENKFTFSDAGHWSQFGEMYFGKRLAREKVIIKLLEKL